jgi:phosphoribosylformylglycinamidine synthase
VAANRNDVRKDAFWLGEGQSRVVVTVKEEKLNAFRSRLEGKAFQELGIVTDGAVKVEGIAWGQITEWKQRYDTAIEQKLAKALESEGALGML